jgi:hypothetical protein
MLLAIYKGFTTENMQRGSNNGESDIDPEVILRIQPLHLVCLLLLPPIELGVSFFLRFDKLANLRILQGRNEADEEHEKIS